MEDSSESSWFLIAVGKRKVSGYRDVVILDYSEGWAEYDIEFYWEDTFQSEPPVHLEPGAYRWTGFTVGYWGEDDHLNLNGGRFVRDSDGSGEAGETQGGSTVGDSPVPQECAR